MLKRALSNVSCAYSSLGIVKLSRSILTFSGLSFLGSFLTDFLATFFGFELATGLALATGFAATGFEATGFAMTGFATAFATALVVLGLAGAAMIGFITDFIIAGFTATGIAMVGLALAIVACDELVFFAAGFLLPLESDISISN